MGSRHSETSNGSGMGDAGHNDHDKNVYRRENANMPMQIDTDQARKVKDGFEVAETKGYNSFSVSNDHRLLRTSTFTAPKIS